MRRQSYIVLIVVSAGILLYGCGLFQKKPILATYSQGVLNATVDHGVIDVQRAAMDAYRKLGLTITEAKSDAISGVVNGTLANGEPADVNLTSVSKGKTSLHIKVGTGDESYSYRILRAIKDNL